MVSGPRSGDDILNSLVNIYDSLDVFMREFQNYLAQRLLGIFDYNTNEEVWLMGR